jgi:hypothetical protein
MVACGKRIEIVVQTHGKRRSAFQPSQLNPALELQQYFNQQQTNNIVDTLELRQGEADLINHAQLGSVSIQILPCLSYFQLHQLYP